VILVSRFIPLPRPSFPRVEDPYARFSRFLASFRLSNGRLVFFPLRSARAFYNETLVHSRARDAARESRNLSLAGRHARRSVSRFNTV